MLPLLVLLSCFRKDRVPKRLQHISVNTESSLCSIFGWKGVYLLEIEMLAKSNQTAQATCTARGSG